MIDTLLSEYTPETEFSMPFVRGMAKRMEMSFQKYGAVADAYPHKVDALRSMQIRLDKYAETGNIEYLMDASNFLMIEYMHPKHPQAHFTAEDSTQSPGRMSTAGVQSQAANTSQRENVRIGGFYKREGD